MAELFPAINQFDAQRQRQALERAQRQAYTDKSYGKVGNKYDQPPSVVPLSEEAFNRVILDGDNYKRMMQQTGLNPTVIQAMEKGGHFEDRESWMPTPKQDKYKFAMELLNFMNKEESPVPKPAPSPAPMNTDAKRQMAMPDLPLPKAMESVLKERMQNPQIYLNLGEQQQDQRPFMAFDPNQ